MGIFADTYDEIKKASPTEKVFIIGGAAAVVAIALYIHNQSGGAAPVQGATGASLQGGSSGGGGGGIQTVPGPNSSNVPILPPGLQPIFDNMGNLLGYQPTSPAPTGGGTTTPPSNPFVFNPRAPQLPQGTKVPSQLGSLFAYNGTTYTIVPGPNGVIYGAVGKMSAQQAQNTPIGSGKYVLTAPAGQYHATNVGSGGGPYGTRVLSVEGARLAPTVEQGGRRRRQTTQVAAKYGLRNRY